MNKENNKYLQITFYMYWMSRVPELDEAEAIDHLNWELRALSLIPALSKSGTSGRRTINKLKAFLKEKNVDYTI